MAINLFRYSKHNYTNVPTSKNLNPFFRGKKKTVPIAFAKNFKVTDVGSVCNGNRTYFSLSQANLFWCYGLADPCFFPEE